MGIGGWVLLGVSSLTIAGSLGLYAASNARTLELEKEAEKIHAEAIEEKKSNTKPYSPSEEFLKRTGGQFLDHNVDGVYDTYGQINSDGNYQEFPVTVTAEGDMIFSNLAQNAVDPVHKPYYNGNGLFVDYWDVDKDGKLESLVRVGINGPEQRRMKIEVFGYKYVLSDLKP